MDAIHPIINTQYTSPKNGKADFWFVNKACYVTTAYFKNNCFDFNLSTIKKMCDCEDGFVFGASYRLPATSGVGKTLEEYDAMRSEYTEVFWKTNYESRWLTGTEKCIVNMDRFRELQVIPKPELKGEKGAEYFVSADIARSASDKNARTVIAIGKVKRNKEDRVKNIEIVNLISLPSGTSFQEQAIWLRRIQKLYNARAVAVDANGVGSGVVDILLEGQRDPLNGTDYQAWDTLNSEIKSSSKDAIPMVFSVMAQKHNNAFILSFMNSVSTGALRLLERVDSNRITDVNSEDVMVNEILPHIRTMQLVDEVGNLSLETTSGGKLSVKQTIKMTKDLYSAVCYLVGMVYEEYNEPQKQNTDISQFLIFRKPEIRHY